MQPHPNLSDDLNFNLLKSEQDGGIHIGKIPANSGMRVQTKNTLYTFRRDNEGRWAFEGHPKYCPTLTPCNIHGSTWGGSMIKLYFIGIGMHMEIGFIGSKGPETITTSRVESIALIP